MLDYMAFKNEYFKELNRQLASEGAVLQPQRITKVNGTVDAVIIHFPGENIAPTIYPEDAYHQHRISDRSPQDLAKEQADYLKDFRIHNINLPEFTPEEVRTRLYASLINRDRNKDLLMDVPHKIVADDLAIVARYRTGDNASFLVKSDLCGTLHMTPEEILDIARANSRSHGYSFRPMNDVLSDMMADFGVSKDYTDELKIDPEGPQLYVLTNREKVEGAVLGTDRNIMSAIHDALGKDFYVLPSSRHELLIIPESPDVDPRDLEAMVQEVNRIEVSAEDFLSDHIYHVGPTMSLSRMDTMKTPELPKLDLGKSHARGK